jgi:CRP-like cAMP-binding protein
MANAPETTHRYNRLLAALPSAHFSKLQRHLEVVDLNARTTLFDVDEPQKYVYFPHSGVICLMARLRTGLAEAALIGSEGFVGLEAVLGGERAAHRGLVQLPGAASRIRVTSLRATLRDSPAVRDLLLCYVRFFLFQALQSVACNGLHAVEARFARWLLTAYDRNRQVSQLNLTQEFMAEVLGVHRPSVTIVARTLQNAGLIRYSRGVIAITNRAGLENTACECYTSIRRALQAIVPLRGSRR